MPDYSENTKRLKLAQRDPKAHVEATFDNLRDSPIPERLDKMGISPRDLEAVYLDMKSEMARDLVDLLNQKWLHRETGYRVTLAEVEIEQIGWRSLKEIKRCAKRESLTIREMSMAIALFNGDYPDFVLKDELAT